MSSSSTTTADSLLAAVSAGVRIIELGQPHFTNMPCSPNHPGFRMTLIRRHGDMTRPDGGSAANEIIVTGGHVGTHVDALSHVSHEGKLHGGLAAHEVQAGGVFSQHGADTTPAMLCRGVLLDVARSHDVGTLPAGYGITADDLSRAAEETGSDILPGDVVLVRTGWARNFDDAPTYLGQADGVPGPTPDAARWLAARGVRATGADTTAYEQIPAGAGHRLLPVHRVLLVDAGIYIIEHLNLEDASEQGLTTFTFVMAPLRIVGGTGSPLRPFAAVSA